MDIIKMDLMIGILGTIILLILFILNQIGKLNKGSFIYDLGNLIGGSLMVVYSLIIKSWPFLALNLVWAVFSLKDVIVYLVRKRGKK